MADTEDVSAAALFESSSGESADLSESNEKIPDTVEAEHGQNAEASTPLKPTGDGGSSSSSLEQQRHEVDQGSSYGEQDGHGPSDAGSAKGTAHWSEFLCEQSGWPYYVSPSGESRWAHRDDVVSGADPNGNPFMYNVFTGVSVWSDPGSLHEAPASFHLAQVR